MAIARESLWHADCLGCNVDMWLEEAEELEEVNVIVIGASPLAEEVRRRLVQRQAAPAGVAGHLRGLRKRLALAPASLVVLFVAGDGATMRRYGQSVRRLLDDRWAFKAGVVSIGLLDDRTLNAARASLGCDLYVSSAAGAMRSMTMCQRRWKTVRRSRHHHRMRVLVSQAARSVNRVKGLIDREPCAKGEHGSD